MKKFKKQLVITCLFLLIMSCSSNHEELDNEIISLKEKIHALEDSLSKSPKYFIFKNINTVSIPTDRSDDSITYKLIVVADHLLINGAFVGVEVNEKDMKKGRFYKKDGFNFLKYPFSKDSQGDTVNLQYEFRDSSGFLYIGLMDEIVIE